MQWLRITVSWVTMLILDVAWTSLNKSHYGRLVAGVQKTTMYVNIIGAMIAYCLMLASLIFIVFPLIRTKVNTQSSSPMYVIVGTCAAIPSLIIYGIFNATNYAIFENYNVVTALIDTLWGGILYFIAVYAGMMIPA